MLGRMVVVAALLVGGCGQAVRDDPVVETGVDEADIAAGMKLFVRNGCATCHGEEGRGDGAIAHTLNPRPRDFRDVSTYKQGHSLEQIAETITNGVAGGRSSMPSYPHISAEHRRLIARFIASLQAEPGDETIVVTAAWIRETLPPYRTGVVGRSLRCSWTLYPSFPFLPCCGSTGLLRGFCGVWGEDWCAAWILPGTTYPFFACRPFLELLFYE